MIKKYVQSQNTYLPILILYQSISLFLLDINGFIYAEILTCKNFFCQFLPYFQSQIHIANLPFWRSKMPEVKQAIFESRTEKIALIRGR